MAKKNKEETVVETGTIFDDHMRSCIVRKDVKEMVAILLNKEDKAEEAKAWRDTSRVTKALIDRTLNDEASEPATTEEDIVTEDEAETTGKAEADAQMEESANELEALFEDVIKAINKGKKKKAKKAIEALEDAGVKGSELKKLKAQVKAL